MLCGCGCGAVTPVARRNRRDLGHVKGEHIPFVPGHRASGRAGFIVENRGYETPCHVYRGYLTAGYGRTAGRLAHVVAYEAKYGPVPAGLTLDHLCRVRACMNPDHVEPVTHAENCRRGAATKLTFSQAQEIKHGPGTALDVATRFGVSRSTVQAIRSGRLWRDA